MASSVSAFLKRMYLRENPLRALGGEAARIEQQNGITVIRCNVGDPTGPTLEESNWAMAHYYLARQAGTGYTDHTGEPGLRRLAAALIEKIDRLPVGTLNADKIFCVPGGTGGLNTALSIFGSPALTGNDRMQVLVTNPFYPPWEPIAARNQFHMSRFELSNGLLDGDILRKELHETNPSKPVVLLYHYPHNPTGKTLTADEARQSGQTLNQLVQEFPNLFLVQEDLYLATIRSDLGIYTPMQHLSPEALQRTILVHSPSKEGHGQDRGAIVATPNSDIALTLRGTTAFSSLGMSTGALVGTVATLANIAKGIDPRTAANADNHRYVTADYYQERMRAVGQSFLDLERFLNVKILDNGIPEGTYYLWPNLGFLKGASVPVALQESIGTGELSGYSPEVIRSGYDIMNVMARAHNIGLVPVMMTPGDFFTDNNVDLRMRIAAVHRNTGMLKEAANTIKGVTAALAGIDSTSLGVKTRSFEQLRSEFPPPSASAAEENWVLPNRHDMHKALIHQLVKLTQA